jgi:flagella basal body P-ring formation protein FlgA
LLKNGLPPFKYEKNYIKVKTYKFGLTSEIICDYLRKNYNLSFPFLIGYDVKYLPSDKFKIKSEKFGNDAFLISVLIDGEIYKKFIVRYKERTLKRVLVAKYFIKSGSKITGDDFVYMQVLMPPSEKTVSGKEKLKYCFAARDIAKGEVLLSRYVKYADIIISGSVVEAVYSGNGFTMTLKLQALQNGKYGQIIKLKDLKNNRIYRGRVKSENEVELII